MAPLCVYYKPIADETPVWHVDARSRSLYIAIMSASYNQLISSSEEVSWINDVIVVLTSVESTRENLLLEMTIIIYWVYNHSKYTFIIKPQSLKAPRRPKVWRWDLQLKIGLTSDLILQVDKYFHSVALRLYKVDGEGGLRRNWERRTRASLRFGDAVNTLTSNLSHLSGYFHNVRSSRPASV